MSHPFLGANTHTVPPGTALAIPEHTVSSQSQYLCLTGLEDSIWTNPLLCHVFRTSSDDFWSSVLRFYYTHFARTESHHATNRLYPLFLNKNMFLFKKSGPAHFHPWLTGWRGLRPSSLRCVCKYWPTAEPRLHRRWKAFGASITEEVSRVNSSPIITEITMTRSLCLVGIHKATWE